MDPRQIALQVIAEVSGTDVASLTPDTRLVAHLGVDSPKALELLVELEERLGIEISDEEVASFQTVGHILDALDRRLG